jgi:hypothetical protein
MGAILREKMIPIAVIICAVVLIFVGYYNSDSSKMTITIQKRIGDDNENYKELKEVTEEKKVQKAYSLVKNANWRNAKIERSRYPDYTFQFKTDGNSSEGKIKSYSMWVNGKDQIISLFTNSNKHVQLTKKNSKTLFEIITKR